MFIFKHASDYSTSDICMWVLFKWDPSMYKEQMKDSMIKDQIISFKCKVLVSDYNALKWLCRQKTVGAPFWIFRLSNIQYPSQVARNCILQHYALSWSSSICGTDSGKVQGSRMWNLSVLNMLFIIRCLHVPLFLETELDASNAYLLFLRISNILHLIVSSLI